MGEACSNCKFWGHWHYVMLADDEPKALGHCVIARPVGDHVIQIQLQGLTAEDFCCVQFQEKADV